jgi:nicotinate-nucleotide adenylyltransferase
MIRKTIRLGIFGGTFDPPHVGHLILASEAHTQLALDGVLWVLTHFPPHKVGQPITPLADRLDMLRAALNDDHIFQLSRVDIDRPPPHYAVDTVQLLHEQYPNARLVYLMGSDSLVDLPLWHRPRNFIQACDELGVMRRPDENVDLEGLESQLPGLTMRLRFIDAPLLEISSSELRRKIAEKGSFRYYLPPKVYNLILQRSYYSNSIDSE